MDAAATPIPYRQTKAFDAVLIDSVSSGLQKQAKDRFLDRGLPTTRHEDWKYTSLRRISEQVFKPAQQDRAKIPLDPWLLALNAHVLYLNGSSQQTTGIALATFKLADAENMLQAQFPDFSSSIANSCFANLSLASTQSAYHLTITASQDRPILIVHDLDATENTYENSLLFLTLKTNVAVQIIEVVKGGGKDSFCNLLSTAQIAAGASLDYLSLQLAEPGVDVVQTSSFNLHANSVLKHLALDNGAKLSRHDLAIHLRESAATAHLDAIYLADETQVIDHHTLVHHQAPACKSVQSYKGIAGGRSRLVFNGKVIVAKDAADTDASQSNKSLLISSEAEVDTKPELQIDHNNVRCSHGATIGRLSADELFYLQSRGLKRAQAEVLLAGAFVADILQRHPEVEHAGLMDVALQQLFSAKDRQS